jgi:hypothetical protein
MRIYILCLATLGASFLVTSGVYAADTHILAAKSNAAIWTYNGQSSKTDGTPVVIADLKIGDTLEVDIPVGPAHHGFITIKKDAGGSITEIKDPVLACDEAPATKPNAVLKEIECNGKPSNLGKIFTGTMKLEVLPTFNSDVDFYCFQHKSIMTGILKLKPAN